MHSLPKIVKNLGIVAVLSGLAFIFHTTFMEAHEEHSAPSSTTINHDSTPENTKKKPTVQDHHSTPRDPNKKPLVEELTPKERAVERFLNQGLEKLDRQNYQEALKDFNQALALDPSHENTRISRGDLLLQKREYQKAIADYTEAIEQNPTFAYTYLSRGQAYEALGKYQEAIADYTQALEIYPEDGFGYSHRGAVYAQIGEHQKAMADLNKAIELNPGRADAYLNRGKLHAKLGLQTSNNPQAAAAFNKEAASDYQQAAKLFSEQGKTAEFQKAMKLMKALK